MELVFIDLSKKEAKDFFSGDLRVIDFEMIRSGIFRWYYWDDIKGTIG